MNTQLTDYILHLADNTLVLGQRNSEWCGHGPVLEQDIAITNISLDLVGQARNLYQYAANLINGSNSSPGGGGREGASEDSLAYLRDTRDFKNLLITEQPNGDWGQTILRQFFFSTYQYLLYERLQQCADATLAAITEKSLKEVTYHVRWSSEWVIRLGDGTKESHKRILQAIDELWTFTGEMFISAGYELKVAEQGNGVDVSLLKEDWQNRINQVLFEATLISSPGSNGREKVWMQTGGKDGKHTEHLGFILAELQFMQRAYPGSEW